MRKFVAVFLISLVASFSFTVMAVDNTQSNGSTNLIIPKRPPINDDGPGGIGV